MRFPVRSTSRPVVIAAGLVGAAVSAALVFGNILAARRAERRHPPRGGFVTVDGVRLHYTDRGTGDPVVLVHGNATGGDDWDISGVADLLIPRHRVIVFDRPGFGHSLRPRGQLWTAAQQAELLHAALRELGVERPVVVGHSWGAILALALAERHQAYVRGLVLISGYYFWTPRPDVLLMAATALPVVGDALRFTVSPLLGWLQMPLIKRALFFPARVTDRFQAEYSTGMALRPSQIRAASMDGALMVPGALALRGDYRNLDLPVTIIAGEQDAIVFRRNSERLAGEIRGSVLHIVRGAGHMAHHLSPEFVAEAVESTIQVPRKPGRHSRAAGSEPAKDSSLAAA